MIEVIKIPQNSVSQAVVSQAIQHLEKGGLIIYPTDTSYGIGALISNKLAIKNLYQLKIRDKGKKLSVIVPNIEWAISNLSINKEQENMLRQYLPGKYTFILKVQSSLDSLGVRIPNSKFISQVSQTINQPFTATSANISGENDCFNISELKNGILERANFLKINIICFDQGQVVQGERSTVVDLTKNPPVVLRQGSGKFPK